MSHHWRLPNRAHFSSASIGSTCYRLTQLEPLLGLLHSEHLLLLAGDVAWARYESMYFDSATRDFYHAHRRGLRPRHKVRIRHHLDRQITFLELKRKERSGRTVKFRLSLPFGRGDLGPDERRFIEAHAPLNAISLIPTVAVSFQRLTLLGRAINERVTLDRHLAVFSGGRPAHVPSGSHCRGETATVLEPWRGCSDSQGPSCTGTSPEQVLPWHSPIGAGQRKRLQTTAARARADFCMGTRIALAWSL